jgi:hypothetical protein
MKRFIILILIGSSCFGQVNKKKLVWEENFNGKYLNEKVWNIELGDGCPNCGWGNNERQLYTNENHKIVNGNLVITAKKKEKNTRQHVLRLKLKKISIWLF